MTGAQKLKELAEIARRRRMGIERIVLDGSKPRHFEILLPGSRVGVWVGPCTDSAGKLTGLQVRRLFVSKHGNCTPPAVLVVRPGDKDDGR